MNDETTRLRVLLDLRQQRDDLTRRIDALRAEIANHHEAGDRLELDSEVVAEMRVSGRRFDPRRAAIILDADMINTITRPVVDAKTAKRVLPPNVYNQCLSDGKTSLTVTRSPPPPTRYARRT